MSGLSETSVDESMMRRCLELALQAGRQGYTPVGSLLTLDGVPIVEQAEEVSEGKDVFAHAELLAVREACRLLHKRHLANTTLYTTAEPCLMCSFAIREARIGRVVIALPTPDIGGISSPYPLLQASDLSRWGPPPIVIWSRLASEIRDSL